MTCKYKINRRELLKLGAGTVAEEIDTPEEFAARYDDDPRIAFLQVGFGLWGEYHIYDPGESFVFLLDVQNTFGAPLTDLTATAVISIYSASAIVRVTSRTASMCLTSSLRARTTRRLLAVDSSVFC